MYNLSIDDYQLVDDIKAGGTRRRKAEDKLFNSYAYYVHMGTKETSITEEEALDAYSDAIISMREAIINGTYRQEAALGTLIYKIFKHRCIDRFRENSAKKKEVHKTLAIPDVLLQLSDMAKNILEALIMKYNVIELSQKLDQLDDHCRKLLILTKEGYSTDEIMEALGYKNPNVVKSSRLRCITKLKELYK